MTQTTAELRHQDKHYIHPWENFETLDRNERTIITRSDGIYIYDSDGNRLIDGPGGMWCVNLGHGRRELADVMSAQARQLPYFSPWAAGNPPAGALAQKLAELAPGDLNHAFFTTSGSASADSALRFVMFRNNYLGRPAKRHILTRHGAYHGSTYLAASVSGKPRDKSYLDHAPDFVHLLSSPNPSRRPADLSVEAFRDTLVAEMEAKILELGPENVAAFIAEPIMAGGGVIVPPGGYHQATLALCRKYDIVYISDEVVTGFGRLGHFFASEASFGIVPDIITCAKGITSGYFPLGAVLISDRLLEGVSGPSAKGAVFPNGFTYTGHPVGCAVALKNIELMISERIMEHVREVGPYFQERLQTLRELPVVYDVRGKGLMACIECSIDGSLALDRGIGALIDRHCQALGLIVRPMTNMCVMSPPLIITKAQIDDLIAILREGIRRASEDLVRDGVWDGRKL